MRSGGVFSFMFRLRHEPDITFGAVRSGDGRIESGGSEAGTGAGVSGGYGAALGGRTSLEDVSPPGASERHHDGGFSALQVAPPAAVPGPFTTEQFPGC